MRNADAQVVLQRAYYAKTAGNYDDLHAAEDAEHNFALAHMGACIDYFGFKSILDLGSGTGRALLQLKAQRPDLRIVGVEPSAELRAVGHGKGLPEEMLIEGDALNLRFPDRSFDLVCAFGILHHIARPEKAIGEMLRVSARAIFISDSNNFGQGSFLARAVKQACNAARLWPVVNHLKTRGKGYMVSETDGLFYSYSVFNDLALIRSGCKSIHFLNTKDAGPDAYRTASHVALLGMK